jgi:hypothetical protein
MAERQGQKELVPRNWDVGISCISIVYEAGLSANRVVQLGKYPSAIFLIDSRRPVLEEPPARPAVVNRLPPPPMPGPGPVPIPIQLPMAGDAPPPAAPGPTPAPLARTMPRLVAGGPITLPPGYVLPPGWAVIPAHNVQIVPPHQPQNPGGVPNVQVLGAQIGQPFVQQGPLPVPAGSPEGSGEAPPLQPADHVSPTGPSATRPENSGATTNMPPIAGTGLPNNSNSSTAINTNLPNLMQRTAPRLWATQSPHPSFPVVLPLFPATGNMGVQYRSAPSPPTSGRTEGTAASTQVNSNANGITATDERRETEERSAVLHQMNESLKTMQDLVTKFSTLSSPLHPSISAQSHTSQLTSASRVNISINPSTSTSNIHTSDPAPSSPPAVLHIRKRRSFSPGERANENDPNPLRRLSSSEDDLSPEELADIRAPWIEQPIDNELPLNEVVHPRQPSPPRLRSASLSPNGSLRRRGSLLKHDITKEIIQERGRDRSRSVDGKKPVIDKGKGKEVYVEDGSEEE